MEQRKNEHIELAFSSQVPPDHVDDRFLYEPLLGSYSKGELHPFNFLGKMLRVPMWVSSMTGGSKLAQTINTNLARACNEFGMGMGLGSCRILLENEKYLPDFDMRDVIGDDLPFYANIGIVQLESMMRDGSYPRIAELVNRLRADGVIIHINPIQEWLQNKGDFLKDTPLDTLEEFISRTQLKIIVKEVGQGMGPESINRVMQLPIEAFELAAFGGTNFARVELARGTPRHQELFSPLVLLGHTAEEMLGLINDFVKSGKPVGCRQIIISGGMHSFLDGYYYTSRCLLPSIFGQASGFLRYARGDYDDLRSFVADQVRGLTFAYAFLKVRS